MASVRAPSSCKGSGKTCETSYFPLAAALNHFRNRYCNRMVGCDHWQLCHKRFRQLLHSTFHHRPGEAGLLCQVFEISRRDALREIFAAKFHRYLGGKLRVVNGADHVRLRAMISRLLSSGKTPAKNPRNTLRLNGFSSRAATAREGLLLDWLASFRGNQRRSGMVILNELSNQMLRQVSIQRPWHDLNLFLSSVTGFLVCGRRG